MFEDHQEIGSFEKPRPEEKAAIYKALKGPKKYEVVKKNIEEIEQRRMAIESCFEVLERSEQKIKASYRGKKIEFFLASDTWMSADKFGHGILELCNKLKGKK